MIYTYYVNYKGTNDLYVAMYNGFIATSTKDMQTAIKNLKKKVGFK